MTRNKLRVGDTDNPTGNLHLSQKQNYRNTISRIALFPFVTLSK